MRRILRNCGTAIWLCVFLLGNGAASGQAPISVHGSITDPSGAGVSSATVHLINSASNSERTTTTDQRGSYRFSEVPPGAYRMRVEALGFESYERKDVLVPSDAFSALDIKLKIRQVLQNVTVNGQYGDQCIGPVERILPDVGPGLRAIRRGPTGNYYVLTSPGAVSIYSPDGKRIGQVPAQPSPQSSVVNGSDLQVDSAGRVYIADLAANAIKIYSADGTLASQIHVPVPISVEPLPTGEVAVDSLQSNYLVDVYDEAEGKVYRSVGDLTRPVDVQCDDVTLICTAQKNADPPKRDWFYGDSGGNVYISIVDASAPTIRKYDADGYLAYETSVPLNQTLSAAKNSNWRLNPDARSAGAGNGTGGGSPSSGSGASGAGAPMPGGGMPSGIMQFGIQLSQRKDLPAPKPEIDAMGVDPANQELWAAIGDDLIHFDRDGEVAGDYCLSLPDRAPLKARALLVEPDRILIGSDPFGISQYVRPDKPLANSADSH